jgi:hypothetical protein
MTKEIQKEFSLKKGKKLNWRIFAVGILEYFGTKYF